MNKKNKKELKRKENIEPAKDGYVDDLIEENNPVSAWISAWSSDEEETDLWVSGNEYNEYEDTEEEVEEQ
ncbi:MAG: hypothetical protein JHC26_09790 [Thermofilum sp.]|jgi:hypothetical protein|uniref:hypothetical protein n=1 Tax=Thermofilum sp. TaxID=1961369 RepID=UPI0025892123|nr:hypothetical protein [Thermofilum sp.]MCI4409373.1 hypothetical protein [Thermofilum sp.]